MTVLTKVAALLTVAVACSGTINADGNPANVATGDSPQDGRPQLGLDASIPTDMEGLIAGNGYWRSGDSNRKVQGHRGSSHCDTGNIIFLEVKRMAFGNDARLHEIRPTRSHLSPPLLSQRLYATGCVASHICLHAVLNTVLTYTFTCSMLAYHPHRVQESRKCSEVANRVPDMI